MFSTPCGLTTAEKFLLCLWAKKLTPEQIYLLLYCQCPHKGLGTAPCRHLVEFTMEVVEPLWFISGSPAAQEGLNQMSCLILSGFGVTTDESATWRTLVRMAAALNSCWEPGRRDVPTCGTQTQGSGFPKTSRSSITTRIQKNNRKCASR